MINFGIKEDKALDFLRKDVKSVITYQDEKKESQSFYNEQGYRTLRIHYDDNESIRLKQKSTFQEGFKTGYINYDKYDNRTSSGQYELNYSGQIISKYHDGEQEEEYQYNELGQIKVLQYSNTGAREIYEYDHNNLAISQLSLQGENSMFGSMFGGPKKKLTTFENDSFGNIIEMKVYDAETNQLMFTQKNKINEQGDEIECLNLNGDGSTYSEIFYDYEYDKKQNWIVKKTLDKDGNLKREEKRNILYYSEQDFSFTKGEIVKDWNYKSKRLNRQRLALLFMALSKNLFQKPKKGQVFYEAEGDGSCTLYFSNEYYPILKKSIDNAYNSGKFSQSNAESDWNDLKYAIDGAEISTKENIEDLELYNIYDE
jgi:hypothetical protein